MHSFIEKTAIWTIKEVGWRDKCTIIKHLAAARGLIGIRYWTITNITKQVRCVQVELCYEPICGENISFATKSRLFFIIVHTVAIIKKMSTMKVGKYEHFEQK